MHLQSIANQLPDAFADTKLVTKSHIPAANATARVDLLVLRIRILENERMQKNKIIPI